MGIHLKKYIKFLKKMIFLFNNGPGRFGNHIYNLFYISALSKKYKQNFWISNSNYLLNYFDFNKANQNNYSLFKWLKIINQKTITQPLSDNFNYFFKPPVLGNNLFDFIDIEIGFRIKSNFNSSRLNKQKNNVAIHFRGTDFSEWDKNSILNSKYYIDSLTDIIKKNKDSYFILYTDDLSLKSFNDVKKFLENNMIDFSLGRLKDHFMFDFAEISECNSIISSPSTFCIWASLLGQKNKVIYHSKKWIEYRVRNNDTFWISLKSKGHKIYGEFIVI